jgi:hypothetical protein
MSQKKRDDLRNQRQENAKLFEITQLGSLSDFASILIFPLRVLKSALGSGSEESQSWRSSQGRVEHRRLLESAWPRTTDRGERISLRGFPRVGWELRIQPASL